MNLISKWEQTHVLYCGCSGKVATAPKAKAGALQAMQRSINLFFTGGNAIPRIYVGNASGKRYLIMGRDKPVAILPEDVKGFLAMSEPDTFAVTKPK